MEKTKILFFSLMILVAFASCEVNTDNNGPYDKEEYEVNFSISSVSSIPKDAEFGIIASCTRDGVQDQQMSAQSVSKFITVEEGSSVKLIAASEQDKVIRKAGDHNYSFYGVYPFPDKTSDVTAVPVTVPSVQSFQDGLASIIPMIASAKCANVVPTIQLEFKSLFSVLEFSIPSDPVLEDEVNTLKFMKFRAVDKSTVLTMSGTVNVNSMEFIPTAGSTGTEVCIDFGENGYQIPSNGAKIQALVAPFVVPAGGMELVFEDVTGNKNTLAVLTNEVDTKVNAGASLSVQVSRIDDGVIPVTFPLYFPIGYPVGCIGDDGKTTEIGYCNSKNQPNWVNTSQKYLGQVAEDMGIFKSVVQPQATAQWHWVNDGSVYSPEGKSYLPFLEYTGGNTGSTTFLSCVGIKGIWTGDYFEFDIPVKKFKANTRLEFGISICNKNAPTFWEVTYLDGEEWKTTAQTNLPAYEGSDVTAKATWAIPYNTSPKLTTVLQYTNPVASGHLKIRMTCVDGSIIASGINTVKTVSYPAANSAGTACSANFYLVEKDPALNANKAEKDWNMGKKDQTQSVSFTIL